MRNDVIDTSPREEAIILHNSIMQRGAEAATALAEFCRLLKEMRDSGLYKELGCAEFDDYCINMAGIKARMAYNYIAAYERLGDDGIREHASLGITKLEVLSRMNEEDRAEIIDAAADMSVSELKKLQEELSVSGRQVEMLTEQLEAAEDKYEDLEKIKTDIADELDAAKDDIAELEEKLEAAEKELSEKTRELTDEERAALEKEIADKVNADSEKKIKSEAKKLADEKVKKTTEKITSERDDALGKLTALSAEKEAAEKKIAELEKKLRNSDTVVVQAKTYLATVQETCSKLAALINGADGEVAERLRSAAGAVLAKCNEVLSAN